MYRMVFKENTATNCKEYMELERSIFDTDAIELRGIGAGVIPYALDTHGQLMVLLGRERFMSNWKGSCRWSGFEGARKFSERISDVAIREFAEESMDTVLDRSAIADCIDNKKHKLRIVLKIENSKCNEQYHCTYAIEIKWDTHLPDTFHILRSRIQYIDCLLQEFKCKQLSLFGGNTIEVGSIYEDNESVFATCNPQFVSTSTLKCEGKVFSVCKNSKEGKQLKELKLVRERIGRALLEHPCIRVTRGEIFGYIQNIDINKDYLEKDQIRWWSFDELKEVVSCKGVYKNERFRPYFLPVLQTFLEEIEKGCITPSKVDI